MKSESESCTPESPRSVFLCPRRVYRNDIEEERASSSYIREHLDESLSMLSEELDSLGIEPVLATDTELRSFECMTDLTARLIDASWKLVHKQRSLMRKNEQLNDTHSKISNDNANLKKRVERTKEELGKKEYALQRSLENERRLKAQCEKLSRDLKREKDETLKLKKQSRSKDNQHEHELRRAAQDGCKLRERLEKSIGSYSPKDRTPDIARSDRDDKTETYKQIILRLEENNRYMLQEINELKDALSPRSAGVESRGDKPEA